MKANELRVGSWYIHPSGEFDTWEFSRDDWDCFTPDEFKMLKGIPITEEWLVKFGFEIKHGTPANSKAIYADFEHRTKDFRIYVENNQDEPKQSSIHFNAGDWFPELKEFRYVHQLQNIYFALTDKELKIV